MAMEVSPIEEAIAASMIGELMGYVTCPKLPWSTKEPLGRVTYFPRGVAPERQSMAIKCYMHSNCSVTRKRTRFTLQQIVRWLLDSHPLPAVEDTPAAKRAGGVAHMARAVVLLPKAASTS